jgi:hypothetical protein
MLGISRMTTPTTDWHSNKGNHQVNLLAARGSLVLQTHATNKVLETGIGAQSIKQQVRSYGEGHV